MTEERIDPPADPQADPQAGSQAGSQAAPPADPRASVLVAAERLYNERGVQAVGMDALRDAAGVPLKRLYREFPSKADLVHAVLEQRDRAVLAAVADYVAAHGRTPRERLLAVFDYLGVWFAQPGFRGCMFLNTTGELGGTMPDVVAQARAHKRALRDAIAEHAAAAGLPATVADQLLLVANGAMATAAVEGTADAARDARAVATAVLDAASQASEQRGDR